MNEQITITLDRTDWVELTKFLSRKCGEAVNIMPILNLLNELGKNGITTAEMQ